MPEQRLIELIARENYVEGFLTRLRRPDDLLNLPDEFPIKPGFYGQGGIGKTACCKRLHSAQKH